ncbi:MAG: hypothetical protein ACOCQX_01210 [Candidatus Nanoarchaeia archaeon]
MVGINKIKQDGLEEKGMLENRLEKQNNGLSKEKARVYLRNKVDETYEGIEKADYKTREFYMEESEFLEKLADEISGIVDEYSSKEKKRMQDMGSDYGVIRPKVDEVMDPERVKECYEEISDILNERKDELISYAKARMGEWTEDFVDKLDFEFDGNDVYFGGYKVGSFSTTPDAHQGGANDGDFRHHDRILFNPAESRVVNLEELTYQ